MASSTLAALLGALLLASAPGCVGASSISVGSVQDVGAEDGVSPVQRVVGLLTDIKVQLEQESASDSDTYDEMACWCKSGEEEKTAAIANADATISHLEAEMGSKAALDATLSTQIADLQTQIAEDQSALEQATAVREKEAAEFSADERQMVEDISNLKNAIQVLSKHNEPASLLQDGSPTLASIRTVLRDVSLNYDMMVARRGLRSTRRSGSSLLSVASVARDPCDCDGRAGCPCGDKNIAVAATVVTPRDCKGRADCPHDDGNKSSVVVASVSNPCDCDGRVGCPCGGDNKSSVVLASVVAPRDCKGRVGCPNDNGNRSTVTVASVANPCDCDGRAGCPCDDDRKGVVAVSASNPCDCDGRAGCPCGTDNRKGIVSASLSNPCDCDGRAGCPCDDDRKGVVAASVSNPCDCDGRAGCPCDDDRKGVVDSSASNPCDCDGRAGCPCGSDDRKGVVAASVSNPCDCDGRVGCPCGDDRKGVVVASVSSPCDCNGRAGCPCGDDRKGVVAASVSNPCDCDGRAGCPCDDDRKGAVAVSVSNPCDCDGRAGCPCGSDDRKGIVAASVSNPCDCDGRAGCPCDDDRKGVVAVSATNPCDCDGRAGCPCGSDDRKGVVSASASNPKSSATLGTALLSILGGNPSASVLPMKFAERQLAASAQDAPRQRGTFLQAASKRPVDYKSQYSTQSSQIYGILTTMLEDFESTLSQEQKDELVARENFAQLSKAKTEQITLGKAHLDELQEQAAVNSKGLSDAKEDLALTREQRSSDVEYLSNLRLTCQDLDSQWAERSATRSEEIKAVAEALAILREDDNREHLAKSVTLLQLSARTSGLRIQSVRRHGRASLETEQAIRSRVAATLRIAARAPGMDLNDLLREWQGEESSNASFAGGDGAKLAALAVSAELDSFTEVKEAIDKMIIDLKSEQQEEVEFKEYCETELNSNDKATYAKTEETKDLETHIDSLESQIKKSQDEIDEAKAQLEATKLKVKEAGQNREQENKDFQATVADQRSAQDILNKVLSRLAAFYKKDAALVQVRAAAKQTPPVHFNDYKNNAGAPAVMSLLEQIIGDCKKLETEATAAETEAQKMYADFVKSSNAEMAGLMQAIGDKTRQVADATKDKAQANTELGDAVGELESLHNTAADLHGQCDFLIKNFKLRQDARLQEMEALNSAKAILSGAK